LVGNKVIARSVDPIEKKPLFHFRPGSTSYSVATAGCNMRCDFCQNWQISQWPRRHLPRHLEWATDDAPESFCPQLLELEEAIPGEKITPREIVEAARSAGAASISYTYTEPTIAFELAYDTARLARENGIANVFVTNGFISDEPLRQIAPYLDAANVDLKFFQDESYRRISRARLAPVLDAIRLYREHGLWVEVTTLVVPGLNDSDDELLQIARFIADVGPEVPWHVSQFYPTYRMQDRPGTPLATLRRARRLGRSAGLRYVYEGNVPGAGGENTVCWACSALLIERYGFLIRDNRVRGGSCPECGAPVDGIEMSG
jgi:pyruvate formate lyase activating enzyme